MLTVILLTGTVLLIITRNFVFDILKITQGLEDLTPERMSEFNILTRDNPEVQYFSISAAKPSSEMPLALRYFFADFELR